MPGLFWRRGVFYGDVGMRFEIPEPPGKARRCSSPMAMVNTVESGYTLTLSPRNQQVRPSA